MPTSRILIVDDEPGIRSEIRKWLGEEGFLINEAETGAIALEKIKKANYQAVLLDLKLPDIDGFDVLKELHLNYPDICVIIMTGYPDTEKTKFALLNGAYDFFDKTDSIRNLSQRIDTALKRFARERGWHYQKADLQKEKQFIGESPKLKEVFELVKKVAGTDTTVLILGESGTGKELIARAIHEQSPRKDQPLITVNCPSIPEHLIESELFGHVRGAFTGANTDRKGKFQIADQSSIFLDEIGDLKSELQANLLRVLQEREFERIGDSTPIKVDVRVIAATNKKLNELLESGKFREDLYFRLNVIQIQIPPLRERKEDIPLLVEHFIKRYGKGKPFQVSEEVLEIFKAYDWPGNVRELENVISRAIVLEDGNVITGNSLTGMLKMPNKNSHIKFTNYPFQEAKNLFEKLYVQKILIECNYNITHAAERAGMDRSNFKDKMKKHGIVVPKRRRRR